MSASLPIVPRRWLELATGSALARPGVANSLRAWWLDPQDAAARLDLLVTVAHAEPAGTLEAVGQLDHSQQILMRGISTSRTGAFEASLADLQEAVSQARDSDDVGALAWGLNELGRTLLLLGEAADGMATLEEALLLSPATEVPFRCAIIHTALGFAEGTRGRPAPYAEHTRIAIDLLTGIGEPMARAHALTNLGGALQELDQLDEADACYAEAGPIVESLEADGLRALVLAGRGGVELFRGNVEQGLALYAASETIHEALGRGYQIAYHNALIARRMADMGELERAMVYAEKAASQAAEHDRMDTAAQALRVMANVLEATDRSDEACDVLRRLNDVLVADREQRIALARRVAAERLRAFDLTRETRALRELRSSLLAQNAALERALTKQGELQAKLERQARTDALTGLHNRRHAEEILQTEIARVSRRWAPLSIILIDIDHFKQHNDTWGHDSGDAVIVEVARRLSSRHRISDVIARWGGEEFIAILPGTCLEGARTLADQLRQAVSATAIDDGEFTHQVTVSIGVASLRQSQLDVARKTLLVEADRALYAAKHAGRNRVCTTSELEIRAVDLASGT